MPFMTFYISADIFWFKNLPIQEKKKDKKNPNKNIRAFILNKNFD